MDLISFGNSQAGGMLLLIGKTVLIVLSIAAAFALGLAIFYFVLRPLLYRIDVVVIAQRHGNQVNVGRDKARIRKEREHFFGLLGRIKKTRLQLLKRKIDLPTPAFENMYPNDIRNSPGTIVFIKRGERDYRIANTNIDKESLANIEALDDNLIDFVINESAEVERRNAPSDWFAKHGHLVVAGGIILLLMIGLYAGYKYYEIVFQNLGGALSHLDNTLESLNRCRI